MFTGWTQHGDRIVTTNARASQAVSRILVLAALVALASLIECGPVCAQSPTTAWSNGTFNMDVPNIVRRSNIILGQPNLTTTSSMPLGNGDLGAAIWAANGFTAQLNRVDTFPDRKSPGQVTISGLSVMTNAANFSAYLDLYDGTLYESACAGTATIFLIPNAAWRSH